MSNKHHPHGEPVRWPTPNRRALETRRREVEGVLLAEKRRYAWMHFEAVHGPFRDILTRWQAEDAD